MNEKPSYMNSIFDHIFPVSDADLEKQRLQKNKTGFEYHSNLPLQISLYFNAFYFPLWFIGMCLTLEQEFTKMKEIYPVINVALFILFSILEVSRLYVGYAGNLAEKIPEFAGFWLLTIMVQLPAIFFFLFSEKMIISPFERALHIIEAVFIVFQAVVGIFVLKMMISYQRLKFMVSQPAPPPNRYQVPNNYYDEMNPTYLRRK